MPEKKRVLITGSNGLLGQKLTDIYAQIPEIAYMATGVGPNRHPLKEGYEYREMDITNPTIVMEVVGDLKPDCIIHTAAMTNVDTCELDHTGCDVLNVDAVDHLVEAANAVSAHFIHISTDFIFDGKAGPYGEDDAPNPLSYYGHSKLKSEEIVQKKAVKWAILRTVLVYGLVQDMSRSNIVLWAKSALEKGQEIKVVDDQYRTPTLAEDLAMGCRLAELHEAQGIFNISGKDLMSIYELVERVASRYHLSMAHVARIQSDTLNQPAKRPPFTGFKLDKAMTQLNYQPHSFEEGMEILEKQLKTYRS
jgi:dTDP-4-dehydrorhamnose reductase